MMRMRGLHYVMLFATLALGLACVRDDGGSSQGTAYAPSGSAPGAQQRALTPGAPSVPTASARPLFTAYNIWYERPDHLYSTGFHVGALIPAGSPVSNVAIQAGRGRSNWIAFTCNGIPFKMEFMAQHHPGLSVQQFCDRLFTPKSLGELTDGFSSKELAAVKTGALAMGMSKKAVTVAYGYPPESLTPTLESNVWIFQDNRVRRRNVMFNENGQTMGF